MGLVAAAGFLAFASLFLWCRPLPRGQHGRHRIRDRFHRLPDSAGAVLLAVYVIDRWEPEPKRLLLFAFTWGAAVSIAVTLLIQPFFALAAAPPVGMDYRTLCRHRAGPGRGGVRQVPGPAAAPAFARGTSTAPWTAWFSPSPSPAASLSPKTSCIRPGHRRIQHPASRPRPGFLPARRDVPVCPRHLHRNHRAHHGLAARRWHTGVRWPRSSWAWFRRCSCIAGGTAWARASWWTTSWSRCPSSCWPWRASCCCAWRKRGSRGSGCWSIRRRLVHPRRGGDAVDAGGRGQP